MTENSAPNGENNQPSYLEGSEAEKRFQEEKSALLVGLEATEEGRLSTFLASLCYCVTATAGGLPALKQIRQAGCFDLVVVSARDDGLSLDGASLLRLIEEDRSQRRCQFYLLEDGGLEALLAEIDGASTAPNGERPFHVLLAEDNPVNQALITIWLDKAGFTYDTAKNGLEVLEWAEMRAYDAVLMDICMPVMDGCEATRRIRALDSGKNSDVVIVAVTANSSPEEREVYRAVGMNDCLAKPVGGAILMETLARHTGDARAWRAHEVATGLTGEEDGVNDEILGWRSERLAVIRSRLERMMQDRGIAG